MPWGRFAPRCRHCKTDRGPPTLGCPFAMYKIYPNFVCNSYVNLVMFTSSSGRCTVNEPYLILKISITLTYHLCFMAQHHFGQSNHYNLINQGFHRSVPSERISEFWSSLGSIGVFVVLVIVPWFRSQEFPTNQHVMLWSLGRWHRITQFFGWLQWCLWILFAVLLVNIKDYFWISTQRIGNNFPCWWTWWNHAGSVGRFFNWVESSGKHIFSELHDTLHLTTHWTHQTTFQ